MRDTVEGMMPDTCVISRYTVASDSGGGQTQTWGTVATVACRYAPRLGRPQEGEASDRMQNATDWIFNVPVGTDVETEDRIVVNGRTFEVTKPLVRSYQITLQVLASEVV